ncbi:hypothetical protein CLU83_0146 [Flavobacterium sp. 1]|uniref:hypothetical protein n=1 Tax=Flavobacterium sp. 1 TaxID=2035200 RepID=UPI000C2379A0|nr:hypothetical protein [Flavobacterium sp. 1]PJJ07014.1 hypothetical protein CLU83_0146 [Flavobacterium sp. 1]
MKKLFIVLITIVFASCSQDQNESVTPVATSTSSVLDGIMTFKDEKSFVKEYSELSKMNSSELQKWISAKKVNSLLNSSSDSLVMQEENLSNSRIIYSDAMKAILNNESKVKIGENVLWLEESKFYLLTENDLNKTTVELKSRKDKLKSFGQVISLSNLNKNLSGRGVIPNENRVKTFVTEEQTLDGSRLRLVVDLFNETIVLDDQVSSSKMFLRSTLQYRSCSTFSCKWKQANNYRSIETNVLSCSSCSPYTGYDLVTSYVYAASFSGVHTELIANWGWKAPYVITYTNFSLSGTYNSTVRSGTASVGFLVNLSWY